MRAALICVLVTACQGAESPVEEAVKRELRDPASAQFEDVRPCDKPNAYSGRVNAKNEFGGYAGWTPFMYVEGKGAAVLNAAITSHENLREFDELSRLCYSDKFLKEMDAERAAYENLLDP